MTGIPAQVYHRKPDAIKLNPAALFFGDAAQSFKVSVNLLEEVLAQCRVICLHNDRVILAVGVIDPVNKFIAHADCFLDQVLSLVSLLSVMEAGKHEAVRYQFKKEVINILLQVFYAGHGCCFCYKDTY